MEISVILSPVILAFIWKSPYSYQLGDAVAVHFIFSGIFTPFI